MKAVKVQYKVKSEYVSQNKVNIKKVMEKLKSSPIEGMLYSSYTMEDGETFVHINIAKDADTMNKLNDLQEFNEFRKSLKESDPIEAPKATTLELVEAGFEL